MSMYIERVLHQSSDCYRDAISSWNVGGHRWMRNRNKFNSTWNDVCGRKRDRTPWFIPFSPSSAGIWLSVACGILTRHYPRLSPLEIFIYADRPVRGITHAEPAWENIETRTSVNCRHQKLVICMINVCPLVTFIASFGLSAIKVKGISTTENIIPVGLYCCFQVQ